MKKRSIGIVIFSILIIIGSVFSIWGVPWFVIYNLPATGIVLWGDIGKLNYLLAIPVGLLSIVFAVGVLRLRDNSRKATIYLCIFSIVWMIIYRLAVHITIFVRQIDAPLAVYRETILTMLTDLLPLLIFVFYFTRPKVKEQFK